MSIQYCDQMKFILNNWMPLSYTILSQKHISFYCIWVLRKVQKNIEFVLVRWRNNWYIGITDMYHDVQYYRRIK